MDFYLLSCLSDGGVTVNEEEEKKGQSEWDCALRNYIVGLVLSLLFTGSAFWIVHVKWIDSPEMILTLALLQFIAQLIFFLHLGKESKEHWNLIVFGFASLVVIIVLFGTLWIMFGLNERVMPWMH